MNPRRRFTDTDRRQPGLLVTALVVLSGWALLAAAACGWLP